MSSFFPRAAVDWRLEEPAALRRLSLSLPVMAIATGVLLRLYRVALLSLDGDPGWVVPAMPCSSVRARASQAAS